VSRAADQYDAYCAHADVVRRGSDRGPLAGQTFAAKDIYNVAGHTCCAGSPDWLATHAPAAATSSAVQKLLDAGATLVGMTRTTELTYSGTGRNELLGTPINPAAPDRLPGGSSSGSAVAVAAGIVDFALGSDTGGSIRIPAALCGVYGLRVTHGAIANDGVVPLAPSLDTLGAFASDLETLRTVHEALLDHEPASSPWSGAVRPEDAWSVVDSEVATALAPMVDRLADILLVRKTDLADAPGGLAQWVDDTRVCQAFEAWQTHGEWVSEAPRTHSILVGRRLEAARAISADDARRAYAARKAASQRMHDIVGADTVVVLPACPTIAPSVESPDDDLLEWWARVSQVTAPGHLAGLPQLTVPAGSVSGAPVALSLLGPPRSELALIDLAERLLL
jgi:amidase